MLFFASFAKIQYTGPAIALSLSLALVAALTLAPALLPWLRGAIFWPFKPPRPRQRGGPRTRELEQIADVGVLGPDRRPGRHVPAADPRGLPCRPGAAGGDRRRRPRPNYSQLADLDPDRPSVVGAEMIRRYFAVGELEPDDALVENPMSISAPTRAGRRSPRSADGSRRHPGSPRSARSPSRWASRRRGRTRTSSQRLADAAFASGRRSAICQHQADPAHRTTATTSPGSTSSSRPTRSPSRASTPLETVREVLDRRHAAGQPLDGTEAIGLAGSTSAVNDLQDGDDQRPSADVRPGHDWGLRRSW